MTIGTADLQDQYFHLANQYYAAAKFAMSTSMDPVSGNLFHHAIELYLKGALCSHLDERRRKDLHHHLDQIWDEFKALKNDRVLDRFDEAVKALDKFENIRYPERIAEKGIQFVLSLRPINADVASKYGEQSVPHYILPYDQMASLVRAVIQSTGKDPEEVFTQISPGG